MTFLLLNPARENKVLHFLLEFSNFHGGLTDYLETFQNPSGTRHGRFQDLFINIYIYIFLRYIFFTLAKTEILYPKNVRAKVAMGFT